MSVEKIKATKLTGLERKITDELLKFATGRQIFCKPCGSILDFRRAAIVEVTTSAKTTGICKKGKHETMVLCNKCFAKIEKTLEATVTGAFGDDSKIEVTQH